ncbi:hypothetical protein ACHAWF_009910 [Thalassiosira exigua]
MTEAEYIALSMSLRDESLTMELVAEYFTEPYVYCKVFEDNFGALELARIPKFRLCIKHINGLHALRADQNLSVRYGMDDS